MVFSPYLDALPRYYTNHQNCRWCFAPSDITALASHSLFFLTCDERPEAAATLTCGASQIGVSGRCRKHAEHAPCNTQPSTSLSTPGPVRQYLWSHLNVFFSMFVPRVPPPTPGVLNSGSMPCREPLDVLGGDDVHEDAFQM